MGETHSPMVPAEGIVAVEEDLTVQEKKKLAVSMILEEGPAPRNGSELSSDVYGRSSTEDIMQMAEQPAVGGALWGPVADYGCSASFLLVQ